ncbi:carboxypeptidase-like regulatory domain-containing protein [Patescibacteria group bacterium]|nr:carboxypeptidase-like regulatory domain-containing protein [Patescibacteria group bacterium]
MRPLRGMSLIDALIGSALVLVVFLAFFGLLRSSILVSGIAKAKAGATTVANSQIEYVRSLDYDSVGTVGGIPAGVVPQYATTTLNNIQYVARTFIEYADDDADGLAGADSNGITTDYKHVRVAVTYTVREQTREVSVVTNVSPPSIETTTGGGTLRINVSDATGLPVSGAEVRVVNASTTPTIDVTTFSNSGGTVDLGGAPVSSQYQVYVTKDGYSSAQTYPYTVANTNPTPGYLTVAASQTTTSSFAIDLLAELAIATFSPIQPNTFTDTFDDSTNVGSTNNTVVALGEISLAGAPGSYAASGSADSVSIAPPYLTEWTSATISVSTPVATNAIFSIESGGALIPDAALPGNSGGFTGTVDLSSLATTTYPDLTLVASLTSGDVNLTPAVLEWSVGYEEGPVPLPDVSFTLTGGKTIGSASDGSAVFKTIVATTTDATGVRTLTLEWDSYAIEVPGYTIDNATLLEPPYEVLPADVLEKILILSPI